MRKCFISLACSWLLLSTTAGQDPLNPREGYKASAVFTEIAAPGPFDLTDTFLYVFSGDTIFCMDLRSGQSAGFYPVPGDYNAYPGFLALSPDGGEIWAGFTVPGNTDDRIYRVNTTSGQWTLAARFPGNYDLAFWNGRPLVSGLNSTSWSDPASIFLLDTTGGDQHRKLLEVGGYSVGLAVDGSGDLYYGTSFSMQPNALYRWDSTLLAGVIPAQGEDQEKDALSLEDTLSLEDAVKLTDLPAGAGDCTVDRAGNVVFNFNNFAASKVLALWNGSPGDGFRFDTLATAGGAGDWLGTVGVQGDIAIPSTGNRALVACAGKPVIDVHRDYIPVQLSPLTPVSGLENEADAVVDLSGHFTDPDDPDDFSFGVVAVSDPAVASASVEGEQLVIDFLAPGQTNLVLSATNGGTSLLVSLVVGVQPFISGDYLVSDFSGFELPQEGFWNGSDGTGSFVSGIARFHNSYHPDWLSWSGWAVSNVSDTTTPGFMNKYSAITGKGLDPEGNGNPNYAVGYPFPVSVIDFHDGSSREVEGVFVTNSTYAALSMENGDDFSRKFGGTGGTDPDFLRLWIWGTNAGTSTDSLVFYLADYRADSSLLDYIVRTWQWVDLRSLGEVDSLLFSLESSYVGDWGMNTLGFFCLDALHVVPGITSDLPAYTRGEMPEIVVYPNPSAGTFIIRTSSAGPVSLTISRLSGVTVFEDEEHMPGNPVDIGLQPPGTYLLRVTGEKGAAAKLIIKQ